MALFEERPQGYTDRARNLGMRLLTPRNRKKLEIVYLRPLDLSVDETLQTVCDLAVKVIDADYASITTVVRGELRTIAHSDRVAAEADRQDVPAHRGRFGLTAPAVVEAVAAEANLAPRSLRKRAARALDRLIEYVDARDDPKQYAEWKAQHRQRELTIWDEMELSLVEAEHERFRLDHPGMTSKQLRVAFNVVLGTRRRSLSAREWQELLESDAG